MRFSHRTANILNARIALLRRQGDLAAAAALALRHMSICPRCAAAGMESQINVAKSVVFLRCCSCGWQAQAAESAWAGSPDITLRQLCAEALPKQATRVAPAPVEVPKKEMSVERSDAGPDGGRIPDGRGQAPGRARRGIMDRPGEV